MIDLVCIDVVLQHPRRLGCCLIRGELDAVFSVCSYALTDCTKILPTQCGPKWLAC